MKDLVFVTGNAAKAEQVGKYLRRSLKHQKIDLTEIQSLSLDEVIEHKAKEAFKIIKQPVLIEDVALTFHALGKLPGPLIKWFLTELGNDGLCHLLDGYDDRSATAEVLFGVYDGGSLKTYLGKYRGSIANKPRGETTFGWDPIFIPEGASKTWAEMNLEEQKQTSMRRLALEKLEKDISSRSADRQ